MGVAAGRLTATILLERKNRTMKTSGHEGGSWEPVATVHAEVKPVTGREAMAAQERFADVDTVFVIRWRAGLTPLHRLTWKGRVFDIQAVQELPGSRPDRIEIMAKARAE